MNRRSNIQHQDQNDSHKSGRPKQKGVNEQEKQESSLQEAEQFARLRGLSEETDGRETSTPWQDTDGPGKPCASKKQSHRQQPDIKESDHRSSDVHGFDTVKTDKTQKPGAFTGGKSDSPGHKARNHGSFYLGVAATFLVSSLGLCLSTLPIFFSLPASAVLFGVGIWILSYANFQSPDQTSGSGSSHDRHTTTIVVTAVLLVLQTLIMDVFIFTRLGSVQEHQNPVIITWIVATVIETIAAFVLIFRHNPSSSTNSSSQDMEK